MEHPASEAQGAALGSTFDRRLKVDFHGSKITSDGGLLAYRELDEALGLSTMAGENLANARNGTNGSHSLVAQFRSSCSGAWPATRTGMMQIGWPTIRPCAVSSVARP